MPSIRTILLDAASVILFVVGSAALARCEPISFIGTRDYTGGLPGVPNPARCGTPLPGGAPLVLVTHPLGNGASNLGPFTSTESHCAAVGTGTLYNGLFTYDLGSGDTFFGTYVGTVVGLPPPPIPVGTTLNVVFNYTLTGGTGLFVNANGNLQGTGTAEFTTAGTNSHIDIRGTINAVPEPASLLLLGIGMIGIAIRRTRFRPS